jgi:hypothetical protein
MGVEMLGAVPLDPRIGKSADYGVSFLDEYPDSPATTAYLDIIDREWSPSMANGRNVINHYFYIQG